jgi:hypothetical protein
MKKGGNNLMSVTQSIGPLLPSRKAVTVARTPHRFHQLLMVGVDKYIIIYPTFPAQLYKNLHPEFVTVREETEWILNNVF